MTTPPTQPKSKKMLPIILVIVLAAVILLGALVAAVLGIFYYTSHKDKQENLGSIESTTEVTEDTTTAVTTKATTAATKATTTATTAVPVDESAIFYQQYRAQLDFLDAQADAAYVGTPIYRYYTLYDINNDGTYELIVHLGDNEAEAKIYFYSLDTDGTLVDLGYINGGHTVLEESDGELYTSYGMQGFQDVEKIEMTGSLGQWKVTSETVYQEENLTDYISYGTSVKGYDLTDFDAIDTLSQLENTVSRPYVDAYVETYDNTVGEGTKSYLNASGDFDYIVVTRFDIDDGNVYQYTYTASECNDPIDTQMNIAALPETYLCIVPFCDSGVAGDAIVCDVPGYATNSNTNTNTDAVQPYAVGNLTGEINRHGVDVVSFSTSYVCENGPCTIVRESLGNGWHVTAKNMYTSHGVTWYELWDTDDGDYYGWVDANYIDFY